MPESKNAGKYPWSHHDAKVRLDLGPRERTEAWLALSRNLYNDPTIPKIGLASQAEGNLRIRSLRISESDLPMSPACTQASFGFTIPPSYVNVYGALQGASAVHLIDRASFLLLGAAARPGFWDHSGVSTGMSIYWGKSVLLGDEITIDVELESISKSSCVVTGRIMKAGTERVSVTGQHSMKAFTASESKL